MLYQNDKIKGITKSGKKRRKGVGKKILIGVLLGLLAIVGVIGGKIYIDSNKMENIVKSDKAKEAIEAMLKKMEAKALTSEGNIKSYKID